MKEEIESTTFNSDIKVLLSSKREKRKVTKTKRMTMLTKQIK